MDQKGGMPLYKPGFIPHGLLPTSRGLSQIYVDRHYYADGANGNSAGSARPTAAAPDLLNLFDGLGVGAASTPSAGGCADSRQKEKGKGKEKEKGKKAEKSRHARPCRTAAKRARTASRQLWLCRLLMAELPSALPPHSCKLGRVCDSVCLRRRSLRRLRLRRGNGACSVEDILGLGSMSTVQTHVAKPVASRPKASSVLHHLVSFEHFRTTRLPIARIPALRHALVHNCPRQRTSHPPQFRAQSRCRCGRCMLV